MKSLMLFLLVLCIFAPVHSQTSIDIPVTAGWNYIAPPLTMLDPTPAGITQIPPGIIASQFLAFDQSYVVRDTLLPGHGYLVRCSGAGILRFMGNPSRLVNIPIARGWNLIGSITGPVDPMSAVSTPGSIDGDYFSWTGSRFRQAAALIPGTGYWVHSASPGILHMDSTMLLNAACGSTLPVITTSATTKRNAIITTHPGSTLSFTVTASGLTGQIISLNTHSLPPGAVSLPALPVSGSPAECQILWTPTAADEGIHVIKFRAVNECQMASEVSIPIVVETPNVYAIPLTVVNGATDTSVVYWGFAPTASRCVDTAMGEVGIPPAPGVMEPRWIFQHDMTCGNQSFYDYLDIRQLIPPSGSDTFWLDGLLASETGIPTVISWPDLHPYYSSGVYLIGDGGSQGNYIDMLAQNSYSMSSSFLRILVPYQNNLPSTISGMKFIDRNNNSVFDAGDVPMPKWKIYLDFGGITVDSTLTDAAGLYTFTMVPPGFYHVREEVRPQWTQTYPPAHAYDLLCKGADFTGIDFGNYINVTSDTATSIMIRNILPKRPDAGALKAFRYRYSGPVIGRVSAAAGDGSLPPGAIVRTWNGTQVYPITSEKYLFWADLTGDLKFGHPCMLALVDKLTGDVDTLPMGWWPTVEIPSTPGGPFVQPVLASWDERTGSPDLVFGTYSPLLRKAGSSRHDPAGSTVFGVTSTAAGGSVGAMLIGGKAESSTELSCWQHDIDSVYASLTAGSPQAVQPSLVWQKNDATTADLQAIYDSLNAHGIDTLYFFYTGHGETNGILLNDIGGRVTQSFATLASNLFSDLSLKRLNILIDASNSGTAIDDFMKPQLPVVTLVTSTDSTRSAGTGLPSDTNSVYTKVWHQASAGIPLPPSQPLNWRRLNDTVLSRSSSARNQHASDSSNAALPSFSPASLNFPDVAIGDSLTMTVELSNIGYITLHVDSTTSAQTSFLMIDDDTATVIRGASRTFHVRFRPNSEGIISGTLDFHTNGESSPVPYQINGSGIRTADTVRYRTFTQSDLHMTSVRRKPVNSRFTAVFPANTGSTRDGLMIKFNMAVDSITNMGPFTTAVPSDAGKRWTLSGATIGIGQIVTIGGYGHKPNNVRIVNYWWTVSGLAQVKQTGFIPGAQQMLLPMPNPGNARDTVYRRGYFNPTAGMIIGVPHPEAPKSYGWMRIVNWRNAKDFFPQLADRARPFDTLQYPPRAYKPFIKEQKNLKPAKYNNHLAGELAALRLGIAASALGLTPVGLGELIYDDGSYNPFNGKTLKLIALRTDTVLTHHAGIPDTIYRWLDTTLARINRAFAGPVDTVSFGAVLVMQGVRSPAEVGYIHADPGAVPERFTRAVAAAVPDAFRLYPCHPNPFNPSTTVRFDLPEPAFVTLIIYDVLGREVSRLSDRELTAEGFREWTFNGKDCSSGVYFCRVVAEVLSDDGETPSGRVATSVQKMMLVK